jgi:phage shock protein A
MILLYAAGIHHACASGDLQEMKRLQKQAEDHLSEYGDVRTALEVLKAEIAKAEAKQR